MPQHMSGPPSLAGQVALITGGSGGMSRAIAKVFDGAGARVVATDRVVTRKVSLRSNPVRSSACDQTSSPE